MKSRIISVGAIAAMAILISLPVSAQVKESLSAGQASRQATLANRIQMIQNKATQDITNRVNSLNNFTGRIQGMKNLSDSQKTGFVSTIQTGISDMNTLESKIKSDTSTTTMLADLKTLAPDYRIYLLVEPQLYILSAVDRVNTLVGTLQGVQTKIQTRVSADSSLSGNTTITADLADMTSKIADATAQASAAQAEVANLVPDQGNTTVQQSNTAALKDARSKIKTATADLAAARKDAGAIVKLIMQSDKSLNATSTSH
jgi:hypothetical protein